MCFLLIRKHVFVLVFLFFFFLEIAEIIISWLVPECLVCVLMQTVDPEHPRTIWVSLILEPLFEKWCYFTH